MNDDTTVCFCIGPRNGEPYCNCIMVQRGLPRNDEYKRSQIEVETKLKQVLINIFKEIKK